MVIKAAFGRRYVSHIDHIGRINHIGHINHISRIDYIGRIDHIGRIGYITVAMNGTRNGIYVYKYPVLVRILDRSKRLQLHAHKTCSSRIHT